MTKNNICNMFEFVTMLLCKAENWQMSTFSEECQHRYNRIQELKRKLQIISKKVEEQASGFRTTAVLEAIKGSGHF